MTDVFRRKYGGLSAQAFWGYFFHGLTAILALWMFMRALGR